MSIEFSVLVMLASAIGTIFWRTISRIENKVDNIIDNFPFLVTKDELMNKLSDLYNLIHKHRHNGCGCGPVLTFYNGCKCQAEAAAANRSSEDKRSILLKRENR
ncbi:MAG: hypothetical protein ABIK44_07285 [candidate division WOR-3 bacterium]